MRSPRRCVRQARLLPRRPDFNPLAVSVAATGARRCRAVPRLFRAPVAFSQPLNALEFARADLEERLPAGNAELARQQRRGAGPLPGASRRRGVSSRVQQALLDALPDGAPTKQAVARPLGMSARNLQRHLADEGTSFKTLLNEARVTLARNYIDEGRLSVTEIAFVLGFADTSTFSRAFKRWTGMSPRGFAQRRR